MALTTVRLDLSPIEANTEESNLKISEDEDETDNKQEPFISTLSTFAYENGVQDRRERTFLGFGKVKATNNTGITKVTEYETSYTNSADFYVPYNSTKVRQYFYKKGLVRSTYVLDKTGKERQRVNYIYRYFNQQAANYVLTENQTEPVYKDIGRIIPFLYKTETITTEYNGTASHSKKVTTTINEYDNYGNVTKYSDLGGNVTAETKITDLY